MGHAFPSSIFNLREILRLMKCLLFFFRAKGIRLCLLFFAVLVFSSSSRASSFLDFQSVPAKSETAGETLSTEQKPVKSDTGPNLFSGEKQKFLLSRRAVSRLQISLEEFLQVLYWRLDILFFINTARLPHDFSQVMNRLSQGHGVIGMMQRLALLSLVFSLAYLVERIGRRFFRRRLGKIQSITQLGIGFRLWRSFLLTGQCLGNLFVFTAASYFFYIHIYTEYFCRLCPIYLSILTTILLARFLTLFAGVLFSPGEKTLRLLSLPDYAAIVLHRTVVFSVWFISIGVMSFSLFWHGGLRGDSELMIRLGFGTCYVLFLTALLYANNKGVARWLRQSIGEKALPLQKQLAGKWYSISLWYILFIWLIWVLRLILMGPEFCFAYISSLFIGPIFLFLDGLLGQVLASMVGSNTRETFPLDKTKDASADQPSLISYLRILMRILLGLTLSLWLLNLWGKEVVFSEGFKSKAVDILFIIGVTFVFWQIVNTLISGYLEKRAEEKQGDMEETEREWGNMPLLDRTQTLLPLMRKFSGIVLVAIMVVHILSILGVNIAPLLAGAGVLGIALGFGAQKLVSDVLSGFFCLIDDAFRVGEYIEAGSIAGSVEKITLRNVMLRHHRGMLQIIPYSDLGAITNYMRGGIVVKFNLHFPYDVDVDKVRKIIKKVGVAMLGEPEYGQDFIKQVKSQGIREVNDSALIIRVKFTAKPGTHFVIRREAYRRITEALAADGIYYAHRKVIVEMPGDDDGANPMKDERKKQIAQAGAAAHLLEKKKEERPGLEGARIEQ